eukprot:3385812-Alexandrium_andersonii.AAC.1
MHMHGNSSGSGMKGTLQPGRPGRLRRWGSGQRQRLRQGTGRSGLRLRLRAGPARILGAQAA